MYTEEQLKTHTSACLSEVMETAFHFETIGYGLFGTVNYKKVTLIKLILLFQRLDKNIDSSLTVCSLTKSAIAEKLKELYAIEFTDHERRYIGHDEFSILYNNLCQER